MNIRDVAAVAGVSPATVSRVLNPNSAPVRPQTRERVLDAIQRLGYLPNDLARALLHQHTNVVGLVIPDIFNPYYPSLVRGAEDAASRAGYRIVLGNTDRDIDKTRAYLETLLKSRADGIIVAGGVANCAFDPEMFEPYGTSIVLVGRHELPYPSVRIDNIAAARTATLHLLDMGHRRVAFVSGPYSSTTSADRLQGYREALTKHGLDYDDALVAEGDFSEGGGYAAVTTLLPARPTAIVAANDSMAFGVMTALVDKDLQVPDDVSLVGFDDVAYASYLRPALTTVAIPSYDLGRTAMETLLDPAKETDDGPITRTLPVKLVTRASSAPPARNGD